MANPVVASNPVIIAHTNLSSHDGVKETRVLNDQKSTVHACKTLVSQPLAYLSRLVLVLIETEDLVKLTGSQLQELQSALLSAYGSPSPLAQMVRIQLDQNLNTIVGGDNLGEIVFNLITWAERMGKLQQLVEGAAEANPGNASLQNWIEANRELLSQLATTGDSAITEPTKPWWDQLPSVTNSIAGLDLSGVQGDVIVANVGAGARNVAIGKNITQIVQETLGQPTADDRALIQAEFGKLLEALNQGDVDPRRAGKAEARLEDLQDELTKTEDEEPDGEQITKIGDWLLENAPEITQALTELFGMPAVGRLLAKAGGAAVEWARHAFEK